MHRPRALTAEALENFRGFGGAQSYPSRTKDRIPVDFSTGSVGLGVAVTLFASLIQDYLGAHGRLDAEDRGRFVALIGDEATVKYYFPEKDYVRFQPANSQMAPILVRASDFRSTMLLGKVVGVYRRL